MKMVSRTPSCSIMCQIEAAKDFRFRSGVSCDLLPESIGYAVCRFLQATPALRHSLVLESYRLRLAKGKERRTHRRSFVAPAALLELPGGWVQVRLTVTPIGVTVTEVRLCEEYPQSPEKHRS